MISLKNLGKKFNGKFVVENVNLKIGKGEIVGLIGPNGAGKTTTLRMIAGVLPQSFGEIFIKGENIKSDCGRIKKSIGYLPENNPLHEELTVEEHLQFWADIKGVKKEKRQEIIKSLIKDCGIGEVFYRPISELSKGFRQRVGLSQAIMTAPDILIFDEPTEGLDPNQRRSIAQLIRQLGKKRTVIISSHVLAEVSKICTRLIIIHNGKIVADDTPENLKRIKSKTCTLEVEIKGSKILSFLKSLEGVLDVVEKRKGYFVLEVEKDHDLRGKISKLAVSKKWTLLTLMQKEKAIEDVFSQLTS